MGDVNTNPWANDEAADWFHKFWKSNSIDLVISEIKNFNPTDEKYDSIRAACHVLICFGSSYSYPIKELDNRKEIIELAIDILTNMLNSPNEDWGFLDMWGYDDEVIASVQKQIVQLNNMIGE